MLPTLLTRKPIDELTADDLDTFHVWAFADDEEEVEGQDETWVRPLDTTVVPQGAFSLSVAAAFTTSSGLELSGFVGVSTDEGVEISHASLVTSGRYLCLPAVGYADAAADYDELADALGQAVAAVFPLHFELRVLLDGESVFRRGQFK
ncbi:hypothetical protein [Dyella silvatica]|uniref:hypothetical protein n=1 Tax=Dyella silvatica TaxID=2992128 RepID=UPI002250229A|nr:hypothetical protein [Dyella silvatica]